MSITDAAKHLGVTWAALCRILNGGAGISAEMALRLSEALGTSPELWIGMQAQDDLWQASKQRRPKVLHLAMAKVGLRIGANRLRDGAVESQLPAIWAKDEIINAHRNGDELFGVSARRRDPVNIRAGEFVIGLVDAPREKVNA